MSQRDRSLFVREVEARLSAASEAGQVVEIIFAVRGRITVLWGRRVDGGASVPPAAASWWYGRKHYSRSRRWRRARTDVRRMVPWHHTRRIPPRG